MIKIVSATTLGQPSQLLQSYDVIPCYKSKVTELRTKAEPLVKKLSGRTIWMISSTAQGGGVAEMLPSLLEMMRGLGFAVNWAVINSDSREFFQLTKHLQNLILGDINLDCDLGPNDTCLYEAVNRKNAESLKPHLGLQDILFIHDPQPLPLGTLLHKELGLQLFWQCHLGIEQENTATIAAWDFLQNFLKPYSLCAFTALEYAPLYLKARTRVVCPGLDPLSPKNRELSFHEIMQIFCGSGLQKMHYPGVVPNFKYQVSRLMPDGSLVVPKEFGLVFTPMILQVSRWDRLKGWSYLVDAFAHFKAMLDSHSIEQYGPERVAYLQQVRLVMAGPDPSYIRDDVEGAEVFEEIRQQYLKLPIELQQDIVVLLLPMASQYENALIVNALQRTALIVVQSSLREGFGLTVTESMWKGRPVIGSSAFGIKLQIEDKISGICIRNITDKIEIARHFLDLLMNVNLRNDLGLKAHWRIFDKYLIFSQVSQYLDLLEGAI